MVKTTGSISLSKPHTTASFLPSSFLSCPVLAEHTHSNTKHTCKTLSVEKLVGFSMCSSNKSLAGVGSVNVSVSEC